LLSIYAYHQPKSFIDGSIVHINNGWLKIANSKNYHHFFPKAYLEKNIDWEYKNFWINHILNITIVDDYLNKREIAAKAPSSYMKKFSRQNPDLALTMKTHLINDLDTFGVWDNNYDAFLNNRAKALSREIKKRIIVQEVDRTMEAEIIEDDEIIETTTI